MSSDNAVKLRDEHGNTLLHICASRGNLDCLEYVCSRWPQLYACENKAKLTPAASAIKVIQTLEGAEAGQGWVGQCRKAFRGNLDCLEYVCSRWPQLYACENKAKLTPAASAIKVVCLGILKILLFNLKTDSLKMPFPVTRLN